MLEIFRTASRSLTRVSLRRRMAIKHIQSIRWFNSSALPITHLVDVNKLVQLDETKIDLDGSFDNVFSSSKQIAQIYPESEKLISTSRNIDEARTEGCTIEEEFIQKIESYPLPSDARRELNVIKLHIKDPENSPQALLSHLSSFLHYLYLSLGSNASFIEPLLLEIQTILFDAEKQAYTEKNSSGYALSDPVLQNSAAKLFLDKKGLDFEKWYEPEIFHYLLQMVSNKAKCVRVMFHDAEGNNAKTFKHQLLQLAKLSRLLKRPALFITKELVARNQFVLGLIKDDYLLLIHSLNTVEQENYYQILAKLQQESIIQHIGLSTNLLQNPWHEENLVSCGPITLELAIHLLENFTPDQLDTWIEDRFKNIPVSILHEPSGLKYYRINCQNLLPDSLKGLIHRAEDMTADFIYKNKIRAIREKHYNLLKILPLHCAENKNLSVEAYLEMCMTEAPAQFIFNSLVTGKPISTIEEMEAYQILKLELNTTKESIESVNLPEEDRKQSSENRLNVLCEEQKKLSNSMLFIQFLREIWQYAMVQNKSSQKIFISYAWPIQDEHGEKWTKNFIKRLSTHLCQAGVQVYLDEFHSGGGYPLRKFMQNIGCMDHVLVINTKTMQKKLSLEHSGVKYEATQIKRYLGNKSHHFVINILLDGILYSDPAFHHYPKLLFLQDNPEKKYYEILGELLGKLYHFEAESFVTFQDVYAKKYKSHKIEADLWHVAIPSPFQIPRKDLMETLEESASHFLVLQGSSGSGKSELVLQYIWKNYAQYQTVYWFNATHIENIKNDFILLQRSKNITIDEFEWMEAFTRWLKSQKNCLIIFDDWKIEHEDWLKQLNSFVCQGNDNKIIMTTTQKIEFNIFDQNTLYFIEVDEYTETEAYEYIEATLGNQAEEDITLLLSFIGKSPYHLACACGYIQRQSHSIQKFLSYYENFGEALFARPLFPLPAQPPVLNDRLSEAETNLALTEESPATLHFLMHSEDTLSDIGQGTQLFLKRLYDRFKGINYEHHPILRHLFNHENWLQSFDKQAISNHQLIEFMAFMVSHLNAIDSYLSMDLREIILIGEDLLKKYLPVLESLKSGKTVECESDPAIVVETQDEITQEIERYQEQDSLDKLTNIERSGYESAFKLFLNDLWIYALNHQCRSKKIYLFCVLPDSTDDKRGWMQSYLGNLRKHLSYAGFSVYPEDITQNIAASEAFLSGMDHVITISTPMMKEKLKKEDSPEAQFNERLRRVADAKPERFILPLLTGKVNHLDKQWQDLAEFTFFKNDYLKEFQSLLRILYGLDQIGEFNTYYQQRLLYHGIRDNQWDVPQRTEHFVGREVQLETIAQRFHQKGQQVIVVTAAGMGGVGKTQLTLQYIHLHGHEYQRIYWIDASTEDTIKLAYAELAEHLKIPLTEEEQKSIDLKSERIKRVLEQKTGWLMVYDNAPDEATIEKFKPVQGGKILVTSRNTVWNNAISVEVFTEAEAKQYIRLVLGDELLQREPDLEKSLQGLMDISGRLPIALALICAYIKKQNIFLQEYVETYQTEKDQLPSQYSIEHVMTLIWKITAEKIQQESTLALILINFCSLLHHEAIPEYLCKSIFEQFIEDNGKKNILVDIFLDEARRVATEYAILKFNPEKRHFSLHFLLQETVKIKLNIDQILIEYLLRSIFSLIKTCPEENKNDDIVQKRELLSHLEIVLKTCDKKSETLSKIQSWNIIINEILGYLCDIYFTLGNPQKQKIVLERALAIEEKYCGSGYDRVANILHNLGNAYGDLGDNQKEKKLLERALSIKEKYYGSDHYEVASTLESLGNTYVDLGELQKAKELLERALAIEEKHYGHDHHRLASTLMNLGNAYGALGDDQKKKVLLEHALSILEKHYGSDHYRVARVLGSLGNAYGALGNDKKKKALLERDLSILQNHYGLDHYKVAITLANLGNAYLALGNAKKAKELLKLALAIDEKHYGSNHVKMVITLTNLGNAYAVLGNIQKQRELLERALIISEENYNPNDYRMAMTLVNLGIFYGDLGENQKKKELLERALIIQEKHYGSDHYRVAMVLVNLGNVYVALGNLQKAEQLLDRALDIQGKYYGYDHYEIAITLVNLGNVYVALDNLQKAEQLLDQALAIQEKYYGLDHVQVTNVLQSLGIVYGKLGDFQKAKELLDRALAIQEKHYDSDDYRVAMTLINLGTFYGDLGEIQKKKELLERALPIFEKHYGSGHYRVANILENIGKAYAALGDYQKAKELLGRALAIEEKHYGRDHLQVADTLNNLGVVHGNLGDFRKAKELLENALLIFEKHYGSDHIKVAMTLVNLGTFYDPLDNIQKKKELLENALPVLEKYYDVDHVKVAITLANLGSAYGSLGDFQKAKELWERALPILEKYYGLDHYHVAITLTNLADVYGALGGIQRKKELLERASPILEKHYGPDHIQVANMLTKLGNVYYDLGDIQEQKEVLERTLSIFEKHYGYDHIELESTLFSLSISYGTLGNIQKKKELLERLLSIVEKYYSSDHVRVATILFSLSILYGDLGDIQKQKESLEQALPIFEKHYGSDHFQVAITLNDLGGVYVILGNLQKAKQLLERALSIFEKYYGVEHNHTQCIINKLEELRSKTADEFLFSDKLGYLKKSGSPIHSSSHSSEENEIKDEFSFGKQKL